MACFAVGAVADALLELAGVVQNRDCGELTVGQVIEDPVIRDRRLALGVIIWSRFGPDDSAVEKAGGAVTRTFAIGVALTAALSMIVLVLSVHRHQNSKRALQDAMQGLATTSKDVQSVLDLRATQQVIGIQQRPTQDVIAQVNATMAECGLPSNRLKSLTAESDALMSQIGDVSTLPLRRQSLRLALENMSMKEMGDFLGQWRDSQQIWAVARIELTHVRDQDQMNARFDINVLISAIYLADA